MQEGQGPAGQQDLLAKLAQAAAAHPHLQRAVPKPNARTLDDIEAAVRANGPISRTSRAQSLLLGMLSCLSCKPTPLLHIRGSGR